MRKTGAAFGRLVTTAAVAAGVLANLDGSTTAFAAVFDRSGQATTDRWPGTATGTLNVAPKDRALVAYAYENSPTFRGLYDRLTARPNLTVWLESVPPRALAPASILGRTQWARTPEVLRAGARVVFRGEVRCQARIGRIPELASRFAHELAHAEELSRYGSILRAPGVRPSSDDASSAETENGLAVGAAVLAELDGRRRQRTGGARIQRLGDSAVRGGVIASSLPGRSGTRPSVFDLEDFLLGQRLRFDTRFTAVDGPPSERPGRPR